MEILQIIDILEEKIEHATNIPIVNKALLDKEDLLSSIEDIRLRLPEDFKQAKWVKDERKRILAEAQQEADAIIKSADEKAVEMVNEHEITKKAYEQANEIIAAAQKNARELRMGAKQYADSLLADIEAKMSKSQEIIRNARGEIRQDAQKSLNSND